MIRPHCKGYFFASDGSRRDAIGSTARQQCECGVGGVVLNQLQVRSRRSGNGLDLDSRKAPAILRDDRTGREHIAGCLVRELDVPKGSRGVAGEVTQRYVLGVDQPPRMRQQDDARRG